MKILFLDHQGVMYTKKHPYPGKLCVDFDTDAVDALCVIIQNTGAQIVISSDWRCWVELEEMGAYYRSQGIPKPIDYTPLLETLLYPSRRAAEIKKYCERHNIPNWVAVDDLDLVQFLDSDNFVHVDPQLGLGATGIKEKIIALLNAPCLKH
jgi:hypothetical protein